MVAKRKIIIGIWFLFFSALLIIAVCLCFYGGGQKTKMEQQKAYREIKNESRQELRQVNSVAQLLLLRKKIETLRKEDKENLLKILDLKVAESYYLLAEERIWRARQLLELAKDEKSPFVERYLKEALAYYRKAKEQIDTLTEIAGDGDYNFHLYYAKGNIYYRVLLLIAKKNEAAEFFNQTATAWETALRFREKDIDTEINLELLYKKQEELTGKMPGRKRGERLQMLPLLPQPGPGIGGGVPHGHI